MLKSSPALDGFHSILKMKRRVGGGGVKIGGRCYIGERRETGEPLGKEGEKRENHSYTSSTPQHNSQTHFQFIPWDKKREREGME